MTATSNIRAESLVSKVFCVTNCAALVDQLRNFASTQGNFVIPDLKLEKLLEDDFIAGFCTKGEVTILPLTDSSDLTFAVQKSVLTLRMSPAVYAGFGLAASKVKTGLRRFHYRYRLDLRRPRFLRNGSLHQRLRVFLSSHSDPTAAFAAARSLLQPTACLVNWVPDSSQQLGISSATAPIPASLAHHLSPDSYCWIQPRIEVIPQPVSLPAICPLGANLHTDASHTDSSQARPPIVDADKARGAFHLLSLLAVGLGHPPMDADSRTDSSNNPSLTDPHLAPLLSLRLLEAGPLTWSFSDSWVVRIHGIFTNAQMNQLEQTVRDCMTCQSQRSLAFLANGLLAAEQPSMDSALMFRPRFGAKPAASLFLRREPPLDTCDSTEVSSNDVLVIRFDAT